MSSIVKIISSSPLLIVILTFIAIMVTGSIASKVAEVMGKRKFAKRLTLSIYLFWICFILVLVVVYIVINLHVGGAS